MNVTVLLPENSEEEETDLSFLNNDDYLVQYLCINTNNYLDVINQIPMDHLIINLCDGDGEQDNHRPGIEVIQLLEKQKRVFTGSSSKNYLWSKSDIHQYNIGTAPYFLVTRQNINDIDFNKVNLSYPLIVKPNTYTGGSDGIYQDSKVNDQQELLDIVNRSLSTYKEVVVEKFIVGREFTVLVVQSINGEQPIVLEPLECIFEKNECFKHYNLKWYNYLHFSYAMVTDDQSLSNKIISFAQQTYNLLHLDGYVRFDLRMDHNGKLYLLDVNPYCAIFYAKHLYGSADMILSNSKIMNHYTFVKHLFDCARHRYLNSD